MKFFLFFSLLSLIFSPQAIQETNLNASLLLTENNFQVTREMYDKEKAIPTDMISSETFEAWKENYKKYLKASFIVTVDDFYYIVSSTSGSVEVYEILPFTLKNYSPISLTVPNNAGKDTEQNSKNYKAKPLGDNSDIFLKRAHFSSPNTAITKELQRSIVVSVKNTLFLISPKYGAHQLDDFSKKYSVDFDVTDYFIVELPVAIKSDFLEIYNNHPHLCAFTYASDECIKSFLESENYDILLDFTRAKNKNDYPYSVRFTNGYFVEASYFYSNLLNQVKKTSLSRSQKNSLKSTLEKVAGTIENFEEPGHINTLIRAILYELRNSF